MLQNASVTASSDSELLREDQKVWGGGGGGGVKLLLHTHTQIRINKSISKTLISIMDAKKYTKTFNGTTQIDSWKSKGMLEENLHQILLIVMYYQT